jgi:hypothetical protein
MGVVDETTGAAVTVVAGRYRLLEVVGVGGMGRVWRAHDELLDRTVAVKELALPEGTSPAERRAAQAGIVREARTAARLDHPHVVRVFDVVRTADRSWIVMEHVASRSLYDVVAQEGPLGHREAARVGLAILGALRAAHAAGVLHRDIKPHNVLIGTDGRVVLTDFGLATFAHPGAGARDPGALLGSPYYVAPERLRDGTSGAPGDLWSLGATLYTAVEGRPPFARATVADSMAAAVADPPRRARRPGPVHDIVTRLLAKDPDERPAHADVHAALKATVTPAIGISRVPAPRRPVRLQPAAAPVPSAPVPSAPVLPPPPVPPPARSPTPAVESPAVPEGGSVGAALDGRRRGAGRVRVLLAAAGVVLAAVVGTAAAAAAQRDDSPTATRRGGTAAVPATVAATGACAGAPGTSMAGYPVVPGPYALPDGWRWHRDPAGFRLAVPRGWTRSTVGTAVCFGDPDGTRVFTVDTAAPSTRQPLRHWQGVERGARADGLLPGYARISMGVLLLRGGGADWEYVWTPAGGPAQHVRRLLLVGTGGRAYLLQWSTREQDWALDLFNQQRILSSLD